MRSFLVAAGSASASAVLALSLAAPAQAQASVAAPAAVASAASADRKVAYRDFDGAAQLRQGRLGKTRVRNGNVMLGTGKKAPRFKRKFGGRIYEQGTWSSPWIGSGFDLTELVPSWSARTPAGTWVEIKVRGRSPGGATSSWDVLGRWASYDKGFKRRTRDGQTDDLARVSVDTLKSTNSVGLRSYQIKVALLRRAGSKVSPTLDAVGAMASRLPAGAPTTSVPGPGRGKELPVPRYSQMIHTGHYPQWGAGGQAWCSPTATSMVLGYYNALPSPREYAWVGAGHPQPWVDFAARSTYDYDYDGAGNWAFNTAYADPRVGKAFVTRLRSLREAEAFIASGVPVIASLSWARGQLSNAAVSSSNGHLMVIIGFTESGDVIVNDPAASSTAGVRRVYNRAQFERQWLATSSGGLTYVIHPKRVKLPASAGNW